MKFNLTKQQVYLLNNQLIDSLMFVVDEDFEFNKKEFIVDKKKYKIIDFQKVSFQELLKLLDPSTVYMNQPSCYNYSTLTGTTIRSRHKFIKYLDSYFDTTINFNTNKKNIFIIKLEK